MKKIHYFLSTKMEKKSNSDNSEIIKEALRWVNENKGLKIINEKNNNYCSPRISSEIPDCSMPLTFDSYNFCSLGCTYCFAYFFKSNNPAIKNLELKSVNINELINGLAGTPKTSRAKLLYKHFYSKKFLLHWGGLADPFCNFEKKNHIGYPLLKAIGELNYPCLFSFKGSTIFEEKYTKLFDKFKHQKNFAFQVSIITNSDKIAKQIEIGVPSSSQRLAALKLLSDMGYYTILRLRPFIIGISDVGLSDLLHRALEAGIKGVSVEFFAMDARANLGMKERYSWLSKFIGTSNLMKYFTELSPKERGGYMRLNRLVKEPYIKTIYKFCINHGLTFGCSDPDFKELCTSGSCCAMPDKYKANPLLENWTKNQLTYHLKEARKEFHLTGKSIELKFSNVYKASDASSYLDDITILNDHVAVTGMSNVERYNNTYRTILQQKWNNLHSPANPRNYLHGKVLPIGVDEEDNLIFKYQEHEYEKEWKKEGIDLTK